MPNTTGATTNVKFVSVAGGKIPVCGFKKVRLPRNIQSGLIYTMDLLCFLGILLALGFLGFNIKYKARR